MVYILETKKIYQSSCTAQTECDDNKQLLCVSGSCNCSSSKFHYFFTTYYKTD